MDELTSSSRYLELIMKSQDAAYDRKVREKLRRFLNLSTGKASLVCEVLCENDRAVLEAYRGELWEWLTMDTLGGVPTLPGQFPVEYFILRFGPFTIEDRMVIPKLVYVCPEVAADACVHSTNYRTLSSGDHVFTVAVSTYEDYQRLVDQLSLVPSEWYQHSYYGSVTSAEYGSISVCSSVPRLGDIVCSTSAGLKGLAKRKGVETVYKPLTEEERQEQLDAWKNAEVSLMQQSILEPASAVANQCSTYLRRDMMHKNMDPIDLMWDGTLLPATQKLLQFKATLPNSVCALSSRPCFHFIQNWFSSRVEGYASCADPGESDEAGRLHYLLSESMHYQEKQANLRVDGTTSSSAIGGVERDLGTTLEQLSVFDPKMNSGGILLFPTYIPSHTIRLLDWLESHLPPLPEDQVHFVHIDSEGYFFQLHTESGGCIIVFTGLDGPTEQRLIQEIHDRFACGEAIRNDFRSLEHLTKHICRFFTLSRTDVVFGGDMAACPLASQSKTTRYKEILPWMDSDILGWFWLVGGQLGRDFICVRSIDPVFEEKLMTARPIGFKNVETCAFAAQMNGSHACLCRKYFSNDWLRRCTQLAHPNQWHAYPQSGASAVKGFMGEAKLHWTVLYYAIADLIKARTLTLYQPYVDIEMITPYVSLNGQD